jgi:hypothetical protein
MIWSENKMIIEIEAVATQDNHFPVENIIVPEAKDLPD